MKDNLRQRMELEMKEEEEEEDVEWEEIVPRQKTR